MWPEMKKKGKSLAHMRDFRNSIPTYVSTFGVKLTYFSVATMLIGYRIHLGHDQVMKLDVFVAPSSFIKTLLMMMKKKMDIIY